MRKVDDGEEKEKKKKKKKEKNGVLSGHYVIASSLLPERLCPNDHRWNAARSCQKFRGKKVRPTSSVVCEQLTKIKQVQTRKYDKRMK